MTTKERTITHNDETRSHGAVEPFDFDLQLFTAPNPGEPPAAPPPGPPAPSAGIDAAQYNEALEENRRLRAGLAALQPFAEDIEWIAGDPAHAEFVRTSRQSYDEMTKRREGVSPELQPIKAQLDEVTGFIKEFKAAQAQAASQPRQKWLTEGKTFAEGLIAKHPAELGRTGDPSMSWAGALQNICESRGLTWEEGWKILEPAFVKPKSSAPPPSMRADAGIPGLPPPTRQPAADPAAPGQKLGDIVLERLHQMSNT